MKSIVQFLLLSAVLSLFSGCRGLQSEMQRSQLAKAPAEMVVGTTELRLDANLRRQYLGDRFDLVGTIHVISANGTYPKGFAISHFTLRPSPRRYYVMHFTRHKGVWQRAASAAGTGYDSNFVAVTRNKRDRETIDFTWRNQGGGWGEKPENFAAYDVSVTVTDPNGKRHVLALPAVPTH